MEHVVCDLCGGGDLVEVYCDPGFEIPSASGIRQIDITNVICRTCGLIFINPRLPEAAVREFYAAQTRPREVPEGGGVSALPRGESVRRDQCERILEEWNSHAEGRILVVFPLPFGGEFAPLRVGHVRGKGHAEHAIGGAALHDLTERRDADRIPDVQ